jgi:hypothetical protein
MSDKLFSHIYDAEHILIDMEGMMAAATALSTVVVNEARARETCVPRARLNEVGLDAVIWDIATKLDELNSWWRQAHELTGGRRREGRA